MSEASAFRLTLIAVLLLAVGLPFTVSPYRVFQFNLVLIYAIAILGVNLLCGYAGLLSLGQGAFFAGGAYVAAILMDSCNVHYAWTLPASAVTCLVAGFLFGFPALRLEPLYLALASFALALCTPQLLKYKGLERWTGGSQGIVLAKPSAPIGLPVDADQWLYLFTLAVVTVLFAMVAALLHGRIGRALIAIRDQPIAASCAGVNVPLVKSLAFATSAMLTGVAGALSAIVVQFVSPDSFSSWLSISLLAGAVIGGLASIYGAILGALFIEFVPNLAGDLSKSLPWTIYGVLLIGCMRLMPGGLAGLIELARGRLRVGPDRLASCAFALLLLTAAHAASAAGNYGPGASDSEIRIGQTMPYSGPASAYGTIGRAEAAYFRSLNEAGGVNHRKITLISLDDGYSPPRTVEQIRRLVEQEQVLLVFQTLGTPGNSAVARYLNGRRIPQLLISTGAGKFNDPQAYPYTTSGNLSYESEARGYGRYILANLPEARIAVLFQNDDYGKDYLKGLMDGLGARAGKMVVAQASYETSDPTVDSQILSLKASGADVFVNVTTPKFAALAIRKAAEIGWKPTQFLNAVSVSIGQVLMPAGVDHAVGIISGIYFRDPADPEWQEDPAVRDYLAWAKRYLPGEDPANGFVVYGYNEAMLLAHILGQCGDELTRENVIRQATHVDRLSLPMFPPGLTFSTSPENHNGFRQFQLVRFDGQRWVRFGKLQSSD